MTGDPSYQSQEAIDAYTALYVTLARGYSRFYGALIASSRLTLAAILAFRQKQELGPDESRATNILGIIKHIDHESFDSFMYVEYVSHLVYATSLLDTFLTETTTFLFLLFPQAMGKSHQVPLKLLIDSDSRSAALTQAAHTRAREISFKAISDRLACIIRERPASDDFARHKIAEEDDGSVKLVCGTWRQALQAHTVKSAIIFGRSFPLYSVGSGKNGNSLGSEARSTQSTPPVPSPCAGRSPETGTIAAGAQPCGVPRSSPVHPVSGSVPAVSRPAPLRNWCQQQTGAVPASAHRPRRSAARGTG